MSPHPARAPEPPPKYATEWDVERKCLVDTITREPVTPVEPVRHAMPEATPTRLVQQGLVPGIPASAAYVCDVRWREAGSPKLGTPERDAVFSGCANDLRFTQMPDGSPDRRRCWNCPYWTLHPDETPF